MDEWFFWLLQACPASCLVKNKRGQTSIDLAATSARGEVLNALLLACAGEGKSTVAVAALRALLAAGAVPDTWAPNGSSALMLAAAADGVTALEVGAVGILAVVDLGWMNRLISWRLY